MSAVTTMNRMFSSAHFLNQDISAWNVSAVRDTSYMFYGATSFNKILCSDAWRASKSKAYRFYMFQGSNGQIC